MGIRACTAPEASRPRRVGPRLRRIRRSGGGPRSAALLLALCAIARGAHAQEDEDWAAQEPRWIPSLSFRFDTFGYKTTSSVVNQINPPSQEGKQDGTMRELQLLSEGELMGPPISSALPGRPRPFVSAGMQFNPYSSDQILDVGQLRTLPADPQFWNPELDITRFQTALANDLRRGCDTRFDPPACVTAEPSSFEGQGSKISADFKTSWHAALGVAFTFPAGESMLFQVKPSIAYNVDQIDFTGTITTVTENDPSTWQNPKIPEFTVHRGGASSSTTDHSLGPGLGLELALARTRPVRASLYADTRFLWLVSGGTTTFSDGIATYEVRRDPFSFRAGAGVRLSWVGFGED